MYISDVVSWTFLSLRSTLDRFLDISKVPIACSSYVKDKVRKREGEAAIHRLSPPAALIQCSFVKFVGTQAY